MSGRDENSLDGVNISDSRICILIRHGESHTNVSFTYSTDENRYPLTDYGREAVNDSGRKLAGIKTIGDFYTSPVLRAKETAEILSKYINQKPVIEPLLTERSFGKYNNMKFDSRESMRKIKKEQIENGYEEWERWDDIVDRAGRFINSLRKGVITIAVSHMDFIKAAMAYLEGKNESEMAGIYIDHASFTVINPEENGKMQIISIGSYELPKSIIWRTD